MEITTLKMIAFR